MSTDIGAIMQLLQRQMAMVPPAYSSVSSPPQVIKYIVLITVWSHSHHLSLSVKRNKLLTPNEQKDEDILLSLKQLHLKHRRITCCPLKVSTYIGTGPGSNPEETLTQPGGPLEADTLALSQVQ